MSTQFFLRDAASDLGGAGQKLLSTTRGAASIGKITTATAGGTDIQVTDSAGGQALTWFTPQLVGITISGTVTVNLRAIESASAVNSGGGVLIQRCDSTGAVISDIVANSTVPASITEYSSVGDNPKNGTYTPTSTTLSTGDRIKVTVKIRNVGTMGNGTVTNSIDGPTASAAGDCYVTFTEAVTLVVLPATVAATATVPAATTSTGSTTTPATAAMTTAIGAVAFVSSATATPTTVAATATVPAVTISSGSDASVTPSTVAASASIGAAGLSTGSTSAPATVQAAAAMGAAALSTAATLTLTTVAGVAAIPAAATAAGVTVEPATVGAVASIGTPAIATSIGPTPATIACRASIGQAGIIGPPHVVTTRGTVNPTVSMRGSASTAVARSSVRPAVQWR